MKKIMIKLIWFYQKALSPYKGRKMCRYYPTCSEYAIQAINEYGAFIGFFMGLKRILRCNPFSKGGYDPVPLRGKIKQNKIIR